MLVYASEHTLKSRLQTQLASKSFQWDSPGNIMRSDHWRHLGGLAQR
jgi:hypothetical protein